MGPDINAGKLLEGELAFQAQDDDGNVWNFGEYPEQYDEQGKFEGAPDTWIAGLARARAGILMRGDPQDQDTQLSPGTGAEDRLPGPGRVYKKGLSNCVPLGCYEDVLVTDETNPSEPADGHQLKYYAKDVGHIRAEPQRRKGKEVLVLIAVRRLDAASPGEGSQRGLELDRRA